MCGIAGIYIKNDRHNHDLDELANGLLGGIEKRGRDATGMCVVNTKGQDTIEKYAIPASDFINVRDKIGDDPRMVLLHTRFTTQGSELVHENNHPVEYLDAVVTHNGVISNDAEIFNTLDCKRFAQVDTECIAASLSDLTFDMVGEVKERLKAIRGSMAIAAFNRTDPTTLLLAKGESNPLYMYQNKNLIVWASSSEYIRDAWADVIGSPPAGKNITYFKEREAVVIREDGEQEAFDWERAPYVYQQQHGSAMGYHGNSDWRWRRESSGGYGFQAPTKQRVLPSGGMGWASNNIDFLVDDCEVCSAVGVRTTWYYDHDLSVCLDCAKGGRYDKPKPQADAYTQCPSCKINYGHSLMRGDTCMYCLAVEADDDNDYEDVAESAHRKAVQCVAYVTKTNVKMAEHILFETEVDDLIQQDEYMQGLWKIADDTYYEYYEGIIENNCTAYMKGMISLAREYVRVTTKEA